MPDIMSRSSDPIFDVGGALKVITMNCDLSYLATISQYPYEPNIIFGHSRIKSLQRFEPDCMFRW